MTKLAWEGRCTNYIVHRQKADGREEIFCVKVDKSTASVLPRAREK